ncbi:MAG: hypothetical protein AABX78_03195, partial [Nanoarchaeota archaeon]
MINPTDTKEISKYLASAIGIDISRLSIGEARTYGIDVHNVEIPFVFNGQEVAIGYAIKNFKIHAVRFQLPSLNEGLLYAPFSLDAIKGFSLESVTATYHIHRHPEFHELLENLRETKRIPRQKLFKAKEPNIFPLGNVCLIAKVVYIFGTPLEDRLCIPVEPRDLEYFPEAEEQIDQGHACMHGESAPYNPFKTNP